MFKLEINWVFSIVVLVLVVILEPVSCWDSDELEVFDVVEEVNQNFYALLDVPQNAEHSQIKKAFRRLSLILHPDKNDAPDADIKFRQLVAVYDILKDSNKRKCYDEVLVNGLPDWKHAVYYYRRVRKMGLVEMTIILFVIITIGQYVVGWASYIEHKFTVDDYLNTKTKKLMKKQKKGGKVDLAAVLPPEFDLEHYKPSIMNTLPFQVPRLLFFVVFSGPSLVYKSLRNYWHEWRRLKQLEAEEQDDSEEEESVVTTRGPRRRKVGFTVPELKDDAAVTHKNVNNTKKKQQTKPTPSAMNGSPIVTGGLWTDDDLVELVRLVKKYPVGTTERWEKIGETMRRPASEVAHMAHKVKDNMVKSLGNRNTSTADSCGEDSDEEDYDGGVTLAENQAYIIPEEPKKIKTRGGKLGSVVTNDITLANGSNTNNWSQVQQKALESALAKYPKGGTADRWEKIANCVPGKTKEECIIRYKQLVELVKKKKESIDETEINNGDEGTTTSSVKCDNDTTNSTTSNSIALQGVTS